MTTRSALSKLNNASMRLAAFALLALTACKTDDAVAPIDGVLLGEINGAAIALPAYAGILRGTGTDSLIVSANDIDIMVRVAVKYTGPGTYVIAPDRLQLLMLVGGDVMTGRYRGNAPVTGQLVVTEATSVGAPFRADLTFDATHESGESRFGPSIHFRSGRLTAPLQ